MADVTEKLKDLANLLEKGLITREQFDKERDALFSAERSPSSSSSSPNVGDAIGAYRILGELGRGGMGVVYRAQHRTAAIAKRQGGEVAIKVLHAQYAQNPLFQERFEREASLGLKLNHPGIVNVHDLVVAEGGRLAFAMELAEGRPLSEVIGQETGPIPWEQAWPMFKQLLDAVNYAHTQGVVHRDLKPENVVVSADNQLKILDFGIAKDLEGGKTKTGTGMGTVDYMAPEQYLDAKRVDGRADIYALGMTFYEMLAGRLPWEKSESEYGILNAKAEGRIPPPTEFYPEIPAGVVAAVQRALSVKKGDRFESCEAFGAELSAVVLQPVSVVPAEVVREPVPPRPPVPAVEVELEAPAAKQLGGKGMLLGGITLAAVGFLAMWGGSAATEMTFITIAAGDYIIGCTPGQSDCDSDEKPAMPVRITRNYAIMSTEVTQSQYESIVGTNPSEFSSCGGDCPVENVSWNDAVAFADALSKKEGLAPCNQGSGWSSGLDCTGYRLPTEAEWEVPARGGQDLLYSGSNTIGDVAWYRGNSNRKTHRVATKSPNAWALYDMSGNVFEWVWDRFDLYEYQIGLNLVPMGSKSGTYRVVRGGSWTFKPVTTRVARRNTSPPPSIGVIASAFVS
jgi:formylglycine-generating enzyme required for sulfatase activity/tRNA A-37 threonylcarbamoyl transferase component Bud32